jgi:hypothetical protein
VSETEGVKVSCEPATLNATEEKDDTGGEDVDFASKCRHDISALPAGVTLVVRKARSRSACASKFPINGFSLIKMLITRRKSSASIALTAAGPPAKIPYKNGKIQHNEAAKRRPVECCIQEHRDMLRNSSLLRKHEYAVGRITASSKIASAIRPLLLTTIYEMARSVTPLKLLVR